MPGQGHIDAVVSEEHDNLVDFLADELGMAMMPSQKAVNKAAANGKLVLLVNKGDLWGLFASTKGADEAAKNGHLGVQKWMVEGKSGWWSAEVDGSRVQSISRPTWC